MIMRRCIWAGNSYLRLVRLVRLVQLVQLQTSSSGLTKYMYSQWTNLWSRNPLIPGTRFFRDTRPHSFFFPTHSFYMATFREFGRELSGNHQRNGEFSSKARAAITAAKLSGTPTTKLVTDFGAANRGVVNKIVNRAQSTGITKTAE